MNFKKSGKSCEKNVRKFIGNGWKKSTKNDSFDPYKLKEIYWTIFDAFGEEKKLSYC